MSMHTVACRNWLSQEQRHLVLSDILKREGVFDQDRERIQREANERRAQAAREQHAVSNPRAGEKVEPGRSTVSATTKRAGHEKGARKKAAATGTNRGAVQRAEKLEKLAQQLGKPQIVEAVKAEYQFGKRRKVAAGEE